MNPAQLLAHFDLINDAPDATQRLRRFVLDLAMLGKLVEQDPCDEPASELLNRIRAENAQPAKTGIPKRGKTSAVKTSRRQQIVVPRGWVLTSLGEVAQKITDGTHQTPTYVGAGVPFVSVKDFSGGRLDLSNTRFIPLEEHTSLYKRCDPRRGDILIGRIGTLGKAVIIDTDREFSLFVSVALIRFSHDFIVPKFLRFFLNSPLAESEFDRIKIGGGTHTNKLNLDDLRTVAFPLPPLTEQCRIVAKVDELLALCDRLEKAQADREIRRDRLTEASLQRLSQPSDELVFRENAQFCLEHFPRLIMHPRQIPQLRQAILDLAVGGKLVGQELKGETGAELLKRIQKERRPLLKVGKAKRSRILNASVELKEPFRLPSNWIWCRLGEVGDIVGGGTPPSGDLDNFADGGTGIPWLTPADLGKHIRLYISHGTRDLTPKGLQSSSATLMPAGSVLFTSRAPIGYVAIASNEVSTNQGFKSVVPFVPESNLYIALYFRAFAKWIDSKASGTTFREVPGKVVANLPFPLPPLEEQHRIVAKVNELFAICERLESQLATGLAERDRLLDAILHETLQS